MRKVLIPSGKSRPNDNEDFHSRPNPPPLPFEVLISPCLLTKSSPTFLKFTALHLLSMIFRGRIYIYRLIETWLINSFTYETCYSGGTLQLRNGFPGLHWKPEVISGGPRDLVVMKISCALWLPLARYQSRLLLCWLDIEGRHTMLFEEDIYQSVCGAASFVYQVKQWGGGESSYYDFPEINRKKKALWPLV